MSQVPPLPETPQFAPPPPAYVAPEPPKGKGLAVLALILGLCGLIPFLGWLTGFGAIVVGIIVLATGRPGKGMAIGGMVAGVLLPIAMAGVGMAFFIGQVSDKSTGGRCMSNLSSIAKGIVLYKGYHDNKWPVNLMEDLVADGQPAKMFRCPSAKEGDTRSSDYFYLAPKDDNQPDQIVVCDFKGNHKDKRTVLYVGMHVRVLTEAEFQAELAKPENAAFAEALRAAE